jgi:antirestriction protein ArdC
MKRFKPNPEVAQQKQQEALELLEQGIQNLSQQSNWLEYLKVQSRFHQYSFNNILLIWSQCPEATRVAGYRTWQSMGRQVCKGKKAIVILAPVICKVENDYTHEDEKRLFGFKTTSVFDISQTEGDELPTMGTHLMGQDAGLLDTLVAFAVSRDIPVAFEGCLGANGVCRFAKTGHITISVDSQLSPLHRCKTLAHELGHALMHCEAEYRTHSDRSVRELEAESVAFVVLNHFGLDSGDYSFAYVLNWSGDTEEAISQLKESGKNIQSTAHQIIDWIEQYGQSVEPVRELVLA